MVTACKQKGLSVGGYDADPNASWSVDNDPDLHEPGKVPDDDGGKISKREISASKEVAGNPGNADGEQFLCATESCSHVDRNAAIEVITAFCLHHAGYQFPSNGTDDALFCKSGTCCRVLDSR